jgi:hypothetical protein
MTTHKTINLQRTSWADVVKHFLLDLWYAYRSFWLVMLGVGLVIAALGVWAALTAPPHADTPTPPLQAVYIIATPSPRPTDPPRPTATPSTGVAVAPHPCQPLDAAVVGFSAPDGDALAALDAGACATLVARSGPAWLQLHIADIGGFDGQGHVWVRAADVTSIGHVPDLATPQPPEVVYVQAPPPAPAYQAFGQAAPTSAPPPAAPAEAAPTPTLVPVATPLPAPPPFADGSTIGPLCHAQFADRPAAAPPICDQYVDQP